jgi:steroid 5-alpha reductase family enzyme
MPFQYLSLVAGGVILVSMALLWLLSLRLKNASIIDIFWGIGFVIVTWLAFVLTRRDISSQNLACIPVTVWGYGLPLIGIRTDKRKIAGANGVENGLLVVVFIFRPSRILDDISVLSSLV